ncbi:MAG: hypothetical protein ACKVOL_00695 [Novosphingobium sp.]
MIIFLDIAATAVWLWLAIRALLSGEVAPLGPLFGTFRKVRNPAQYWLSVLLCAALAAFFASILLKDLGW